MPSEGRARVAHRDLEALGRFRRLKTLDDGNSAHGVISGNMNDGVFLVKRKKDGLVCVQKRIPTRDKHLLNEIRILRLLEHPNICQYIDASISNDDPPPLRASLYVEYCDSGSLEMLLQKYRERSTRPRARAYIPEGFIWKVFLELCSALQYLHHGIEADNTSPPKDPPEWRRVLHRDIKPANVFLKSGLYSKYPTVVLGDFGCAIKYGMKGWNDTTTLAGTSAWQPPEIPEHTTRGDVWALGAVVQSLCRLDQGPVSSPPLGVEHEIWWISPEARRPRRAGAHYSVQLNCVMQSALTILKEQRPFAYQLYRDLKERSGRARGDEGVVDEAFPLWAFERR